MACSCIRNTAWQFDIEVLDVKTLRYNDYSDWNDNDPYEVPLEHKIFITTPSNKKVELNVNAKGSTILTSEDLGFGGQCVTDGIYCIEAYSCKSCKDNTWGEKKFTKQIAILPQSECKVSNLVATEQDSVGDTMSKKLKQIQAVSAIGQNDKAIELFKIFNRELEKLNCSSCC